MRNLKELLFFLYLFGFFSIVGYICAKQINNTILAEISLNSASMFIGIIITTQLIDKVIADNLEQERMKIRNIALKQLFYLFNRHVHFLMKLYKVSMEPTSSPPKNLEELLNSSTYIDVVSYLDFDKPAPDDGKWAFYISNYLMDFKKELNDIINRYINIFNSNEIELLQKILNNYLANSLETTQIGRKNELLYNLFRKYADGASNPTRDCLQEYILDVYLAILLINKNNEKDINLLADDFYWQDNILPAKGSSRVNKEYD